MKNNNYSTNKNKGFSLIEVMIVVAIIGIIASVAFPSYQDSVRKARRTDGIEAVLNCAAAMKKQFTVTNTFAGNTPNECTNTSKEGFYNIAIDNSDATTFTVSATPPAGSGQANDLRCLAFTITITGLEEVTGSGDKEYCCR